MLNSFPPVWSLLEVRFVQELNNGAHQPEVVASNGPDVRSKIVGYLL